MLIDRKKMPGPCQQQAVPLFVTMIKAGVRAHKHHDDLVLLWWNSASKQSAALESTSIMQEFGITTRWASVKQKPMVQKGEGEKWESMSAFNNSPWHCSYKPEMRLRLTDTCGSQAHSGSSLGALALPSVIPGTYYSVSIIIHSWLNDGVVIPCQGVENTTK